MKPFVLIALLGLILAKKVQAVPLPADVIDSTPDKAVSFGSEAPSINGRYQLGWTIRPTSKAEKPVDWTHYDLNHLRDFFDDYGFDTDSKEPRYQWIDCIIDLQRKVIMDLPQEFAQTPCSTHGGIFYRWSRPFNHTCYGVVEHHARWFTMHFCLVIGGEKFMREIELTDVLNAATTKILREKRPLDYRRYGSTFSTYGVEFGESTVKIPFNSDLGNRSTGDSAVTGSITLRLPEGTVLKTTCVAPVVNPLVDDPHLAVADHELNDVYTRLIQKLDKTSQAALRKEQNVWIQDRDQTPAEIVFEWGNGTHENRNKSLLDSTRARTAELRKRLEAVPPSE